MLRFILKRPDARQEAVALRRAAELGYTPTVRWWEVLEELVNDLGRTPLDDTGVVFVRHEENGRDVEYSLEEMQTCIRHDIECR